MVGFEKKREKKTLQFSNKTQKFRIFQNWKGKKKFRCKKRDRLSLKSNTSLHAIDFGYRRFSLRPAASTALPSSEWEVYRNKKHVKDFTNTSSSEEIYTFKLCKGTKRREKGCHTEGIKRYRTEVSPTTLPSTKTETKLLWRKILLNIKYFVEGEKDRIRCVRALSRVLAHLNNVMWLARCHRHEVIICDCDVAVALASWPRFHHSQVCSRHDGRQVPLFAISETWNAITRTARETLERLNLGCH